MPIKITFPNSQVKKPVLKPDPVEDYYPRLKSGLSYEPPKPKKKTVAQLSKEVELLQEEIEGIRQELESLREEYYYHSHSSKKDKTYYGGFPSIY